MQILFATKNKGKIEEISDIMADLEVEILSMEQAGFTMDIEETGKTFEENALIKATALMKKSAKLALSDDSGLEIDFLDKAPGVYSARYLGENTPYSIKNKEILSLMKDVPDTLRTARFICVIAAVFPDGRAFTVRGTMEGLIAHAVAGENGFGYDPIFYVPKLGMTTAQMQPKQKNEISHRGKALRQMKEKLRIELEAHV